MAQAHTRRTMYIIQMTQTPYFLVQNMRRYWMWSCHPETSIGHPSAPTLHLRTPGYSETEIEDIPQPAFRPDTVSPLS